VLPAGSLITVFGGSGFIGRHTVRLLARHGYRVRAAERRPDLAGHLQPMGGPGQVMAVQANLRDADSIRRAVDGAAGVVNLVAVLAEAGRQRFEALHVAGARNVARAAKEAGAQSLVQVSAIGASARSPSKYAQTKARGEAAVLAEFPGAIILRPSIVFGPEDNFFNRFAGMAQVLPLMPVISGKTRFQPVYVGDVAAAIVAGLEGAARPGVPYELGGPEVFTFRELLAKTAEWSGHKRPLVWMPVWKAKLLAALTKPLPSAMRPMTVDQVRLLTVDNVVSKDAQAEGRTLAGLGVGAPQTIETLVPGYLERFNPRGQYAHYRA
jgi:uncharacterized protein YbjT (DUF2867 family)